MGRGRAASIKSIAGGENDGFLTCLGETDKGRVCERWPGRPPGLTPGGFFPCVGTGGSVDEGRGPCACPLWEFHLVRRDKGCCGADAGALCLSSLGIEQTTWTSTRPPPNHITTPCPYTMGRGWYVEWPMKFGLCCDKMA